MAEKAEELTDLFKSIASGDKKAFESLFRNNYDSLKKFALSYVRMEETADEIVSGLFVKIWIRRLNMITILNPRIYLFVSVKNACLNYLRKAGKVKFTSLEDSTNEKAYANTHNSPETAMENKQLQARLDAAINALPAQRRLIFKMVKEDGLKYREVAKILSISIRTVEGQMYKAIKTLAENLTSHLGYNPAQTKRPLARKLFTLLF